MTKYNPKSNSNLPRSWIKGGPGLLADEWVKMDGLTQKANNQVLSSFLFYL